MGESSRRRTRRSRKGTLALGESRRGAAGGTVQSFVGDPTWSCVGVERFGEESREGDGDGW